MSGALWPTSSILDHNFSWLSGSKLCFLLDLLFSSLIFFALNWLSVFCCTDSTTLGITSSNSWFFGLELCFLLDFLFDFPSTFSIFTWFFVFCYSTTLGITSFFGPELCPLLDSLFDFASIFSTVVLNGQKAQKGGFEPSASPTSIN